MPGIRELSKLQIGREVTPGTGVVATTVWRGVGAMPDDERHVVRPLEQIGILGGTDRSYIDAISAKLSLNPTPATFEQLQHLLANAYGGPIAGTADGVGTDKIYTTTIPTISVPTQNYAWTVQGGDNFEVEQLRYGKVVRIELTGEMNKAVHVKAELIGQESTYMAAGFTASVALPAVEELLTNKMRVYIDAIGGTYGATLIANQVIGFHLVLEAQWEPLPVGGFVYWTVAQFVGKRITGTVTFLHDVAVSGASGAKLDWRNQTPKLLSIRVPGSNVVTAGTTYSTRMFIANLPLKWDSFPALSDLRKNSIITGSFESEYNVTAGNAGTVIVVNELATLP